jgi:AraC-like DNA-binding protein
MLSARTDAALKDSAILDSPDLSSSRAGSDPAPSVLCVCAPPIGLAAQVFGFVCRDDLQGGQVVRLLPEVRMSIQIFLADSYFLREQSVNAQWQEVPRIGLWGPRYRWAHGFAQRHIRVYAIGLTPLGLRALWPGSVTALLNRVVDLGDSHALLAAQLAPTPAETFATWQIRAAGHLHDYLRSRLQHIDPLSTALSVLATGEGRSVADAAAVAGWSERQFRRVFAQRMGVSPKHYQRAVRVDRMLKQLHTHAWEGDEFADQPIAFADQPHAIREFRTMTGLTPGQYLRAKHQGDATLRSVPVHDVIGPTFAM